MRVRSKSADYTESSLPAGAATSDACMLKIVNQWMLPITQETAHSFIPCCLFVPLQRQSGKKEWQRKKKRNCRVIRSNHDDDSAVWQIFWVIPRLCKRLRDNKHSCTKVIFSCRIYLSFLFFHFWPHPLCQTFTWPRQIFEFPGSLNGF